MAPMSQPTETAVSIEQVAFRYPGADAPALEGVSLRVMHGERLGILGPNGGGKSTLLKLVLGLLEPTSGTIRVFGVSPKEARHRGYIGYVPQRPEVELGLPLSARDVVMLGALWRVPPWKSLAKEDAERVGRTIELVGASAYADRPVGKLSGGQMQRILIARALVCQPRILALDEPMVGIDASGQRTFAELLAKVHGELGVTMLTVTHDLRAIAAGSDRVACLARRLHSHGSPQGLTPRVLAELFSHDIAGLSGELGGMHVHAHGPGEACPAPEAKAPGCGHDHGHEGGGHAPH